MSAPPSSPSPRLPDLEPTHLRQLADDVGYELMMLSELAPVATPAQDPFLGSALLESTLLHLRNLDVFLGSLEPVKDDVIARHYLDRWSPTPILTDDERDDLNKRLMHLSQQRVRLHAEWDRIALTTSALDVFDVFVAELRIDFPARAAWFESYALDARQRLGR